MKNLKTAFGAAIVRWIYSIKNNVWHLERWFRDPGSWIKQFPVGDLEVAFFATGPRWVLKNIYNINIYIYIYTCIYIYN